MREEVLLKAEIAAGVDREGREDARGQGRRRRRHDDAP